MRHFFQKHHHVDASHVKGRINPIDFYVHEGQEVAAHGRSSWKSAGICPFHADRKKGSFYVNHESGAFRCFSCDARGGDIIAFVQKKYELAFKEALEKLTSEWRVA